VNTCFHATVSAVRSNYVVDRYVSCYKHDVVQKLKISYYFSSSPLKQLINIVNHWLLNNAVAVNVPRQTIRFDETLTIMRNFSLSLSVRLSVQWLQFSRYRKAVETSNLVET